MILWLNPFSGLSGDMLLAALLDVGAPPDEVRAAIASTGISGWRLTSSTVQRGGLRACQAIVQTDETGRGPGRQAAELAAIAGAAEPAPVGRLAAAAVHVMAEAEARIHGTSADLVHLHELGGIDTVVDTVGVAAAIHALDISEVWSGPVAIGSGEIESAHGLLPVPAPATLALLGEAEVTGLGPVGETVTPTGAALLRALGCQYGPVPRMRVTASGYGAGSRDTPGRPNVLPVLLGAPLDEPAAGRSDLLIVVETTVDDVTGEVLGTLPGQLISGGALDAWITAVTGKKGRPAHVITALCPPATADAVESTLLAATGSLGARRHEVTRQALPRATTTVEFAGHQVRVKIGPHRAKPEHDDVAAVAAATGLPIRTVAEEVLAALPRSPSQRPNPS